MKLLEDQDAQFMLLAGFIIAIGLVITTVMLTSIIFEVNMALGAGADPFKSDMVNLIQITQDETRSAYRNVTAPRANYSLRFINFSKQMKNFNQNLSRIYALHGEGVNVTLDVSDWSSNRYPNFTENGTAIGTQNWTVMESVTSSTINVSITSITPPFYMDISNTTKSWQITFTSTGTSSINNSEISKNIMSSYNITFIYGSNAAGNYSITGTTAYGRNFTRSRDYMLNATVLLSTSSVHANITVPVSVPW